MSVIPTAMRFPKWQQRRLSEQTRPAIAQRLLFHHTNSAFSHGLQMGIVGSR